MHTAHAIAGHAVLIPVVFALLGGLAYVVRHLGAPEHAGWSDPLDAELVRRWNLQAHN